MLQFLWWNALKFFKNGFLSGLSIPIRIWGFDRARTGRRENEVVAVVPL